MGGYSFRPAAGSICKIAGYIFLNSTLLIPMCFVHSCPPIRKPMASSITSSIAPGATKCVDKNDFDRVNYLQTRNFADTLRNLDMIPGQFVFISTLSVFGPVHEKVIYSDKGRGYLLPNTAYGLSKLKAEAYLQSMPDFPYVIYRPTGVYGPREKDYFLVAKSIRQHTDFSVGFRRQDLTFVYVKDIVQAVFLWNREANIPSRLFPGRWQGVSEPRFPT